MLGNNTIFFSSNHIYALPPGHRFPIAKYQLVYEQLIYEGTIRPEQVSDPGLCEEEHILRIHSLEYWQKLQNQTLSKSEIRKIGLPVNSFSVKRARNSVQGTISAAEEALRNQIGLNLAGGTHHAYADRGEGFCILNDLAVASRYLLVKHGLTKILIIDLDVHQGNGTARIFEEEASVFTFSMHARDNYPMIKEKSDLDIELAKGTRDQEYLKTLSGVLPGLLAEVRPEIVFYQAGVDVLETDSLGKLALSKQGAKHRDELVISGCLQQKTPLVITMGGGYSPKIYDIVEAHCNTFRTALKLYS